MFDEMKIVTFENGVELIKSTLLNNEEIKIAVDGLPGAGKTYFIRELIRELPLKTATIIDDGTVSGWFENTILLPSISWKSVSQGGCGQLELEELKKLGLSDDKVVVSSMGATYFLHDVDVYVIIICSEHVRLKNLDKRNHRLIYGGHTVLEINPEFKFKEGFVVVNEKLIPNEEYIPDYVKAPHTKVFTPSKELIDWYSELASIIIKKGD